MRLGNLWSAASQLTSLTQDDKPRTVFARESKNKAVIVNLMKAQSSILDLRIVSRVSIGSPCTNCKKRMGTLSIQTTKKKKLYIREESVKNKGEAMWGGGGGT